MSHLTENGLTTTIPVTGRVPKLPRVIEWVEEVAALTNPSAIHFLDGSDEEYERLVEKLVEAGTLVRLNPDKQPGSVYARTDANATREQKAVLKALSPEQVTATALAGEEITAKLTHAPGNGAPIGGLKVCTENAWFAARPSGTEDKYKIYAESFLGEEHLAKVQSEAAELVDDVLGG